MNKRNLLFTIQYDGSGYNGWQRQPEVPTVQGTLEAALSKLFCIPVSIHGTSRTDAGVHALGQQASFAGVFGIPTEKILFPLNNMLPGDIHITQIREMPEEFHARYDAKAKTYRYRIRNTMDKDIFLRNYVYWIRHPLDVESMSRGASWLQGTHDFAAFQASGGEVKATTVRTIHRVQLTQEGDDLLVEVTGDGFLYNMVRILVGTLVEVGLGKIPPDRIKDILSSGDRSKAGHTAPPQGLYLMNVYYSDEEWK